MRLLLVEDNPGDVRLIREAFREADARTEIAVASDGEMALKLLREDGQRPELILLDLNLPKIDGTEVLAQIKSDVTLRSIPVLILSSSHSRDDILNSYNNHANCYISKPHSFEGFVDVAKGIGNFWEGLASLPGRFAPM